MRRRQPPARPRPRLPDVRRGEAASASSASSSATASAGACTRTRRSRTTGRPARGPELREGMVFAIEPMITAGSHDIRARRRRLVDLHGRRLAGGALRAHRRDHRRRPADPDARARRHQRRRTAAPSERDFPDCAAPSCGLCGTLRWLASGPPRVRRALPDSLVVCVDREVRWLASARARTPRAASPHPFDAGLPAGEGDS